MRKPFLTQIERLSDSGLHPLLDSHLNSPEVAFPGSYVHHGYKSAVKGREYGILYSIIVIAALPPASNKNQ